MVLLKKIFGYNFNSDNKPDFIDVGIGLKIIPLKNANDESLSSRQRLA